MITYAFDMHGDMALEPRAGDVGYSYADADSDEAAARKAADAASDASAGRLCQGTMFTGRARVDAAGARECDRTLLCGWIAQSSLAGGDEDRPAPARLQRMLDDGGPAAARRLRGDFVLAHLSADRAQLRLYRGLTSLVPLFWRLSGDRLRWSTDPTQLLDGPLPRLADVATELLPMVIAERGFPHDRSWFTDVHRLPAGSCVTLRRGTRPVVETFDAFAAAENAPASLREAADGLRERLGAACRTMLSPGDEAILLLSGGIDSAAIAHELGATGATATGLHFTLGGFPGFAADRQAAASIAEASDLSFSPYDMGRHVRTGGDYTDEPSDGALPQTHVPLQGVAASGRQAQAIGARFVLSGILSDQILAHDWHRGLLDVAGWSILNPLVTGEPPWQVLQRAVRTSFEGSASPGWRGYLGYLRGLYSADPTMALPNRDSIVHPIGLSAGAAERVTQSLRDAADRARGQLLAGVAQPRRRTIPAGTTSLFQVNESFNTPNVQAAILNHFLPRQCFFAMPFADRDVIEYALSLPTVFRLGLGHGATIDKFALRVAYADTRLPPRIGGRMQQARIDAFPAVYVNQNFDTCRALLGEDSRLQEAGVLSDAFVRGMSRQSAHRNGEEIARLCVVERWLRRLAA
jgi:hypothetical protein